MLVQNISPVNYAGNQSFSGKSKNVEAVVNKAFDKIVEAKSKNLGSFIGTTKQGDNVVIQETLLGKAADLFISFSENARNKGIKDFAVYHLTRTIGKPSGISTDYVEKLQPKEVSKVKNILDTLV